MSDAIQFSPSEVAAYFAARVPRLKQTHSGEWRGPCPIHGGKDDNFAVNPVNGLCVCHSQCQRGWDIVGVEMALTGTDFQTAKEEVFHMVGRVEPTSTKGKWREIARYPYVDRHGSLLFEVVRKLTPEGRKVFIPERPSGVEAVGTTDPERAGGVPTGGIVVGINEGRYVRDSMAERRTGKPTWRMKKNADTGLDEYNFRACPRVPFRFPRLLNAEAIYLVEGERDVTSLEAWGLTATCNSGGSGNSDLYAGWTEDFRGHHLIILPDNDGPGRKHAAAVATTMLPVGRSVRVVELPGLPEGGDVTDWRNGGGTVEELLRLVAAAPVIDAAALSDLRARWNVVDEKPRHQARPASAGNWPKPELLQSELPPVTAFSEDLLPDSLRSIVNDVAERMQVPADYPAVVEVLNLAGAVNRRAVIQPKAKDTGWVVVPNLWGAIIAPPGFMKSPVIQAATRPLNHIQTEWRVEYESELKEHALAVEEYELQLAVWKEKYKKASKGGAAAPDRPAEEPEQPTLRRLIVHDATFEALHQIMSDNPAGVFVIRDELTGWWSQLDRAGREGERAFHLQAWNGDTGHTIDRIGRGTIYVEACCTCMLGGIQPGRLRSYLVDAVADGPGNDGLIQRFQVMVWPDTSPDWKYVDRPPTVASEEQSARVFRKLVELDPENPARFRFAPSAQELFMAWLEVLERKIRGDDLHPALVSHLSKYRSLMPSLALLFELADRASSEGFDGVSLAISENFASLKNTSRAAAWCDYLESHARRIYSCIVSPELRAARELAGKIKRQQVGADGTFSCREVYLKGWSGLDTPEAVKLAAEVLQDAGWVREIPTESGKFGGRPSNRYEVNPRVWE